jgi:hypothetical protein
LAAIVVDISGYLLLLQLLLLVKWFVFQLFVHEVFRIVHGVHRALLLHITSFQKFDRFKSYVDSLCCLILYLLNPSEKTEFELRKDAFISAGALPILISLHSKLASDEYNSEGLSYHDLDQAISLLNGE